MDANDELQRVYVIQDESSHWYVIPFEQQQRWHELEEECAETDDYDLFESVFGKYRTGGSINNVELFAKLKPDDGK